MTFIFLVFVNSCDRRRQMGGEQGTWVRVLDLPLVDIELWVHDLGPTVVK